jgi:hypothetical protein
MNLRELGWGGMDWIDLAHYRDQWRALVYAIVGKFLNSWVSGSLPRTQLHGVSYH